MNHWFDHKLPDHHSLIPQHRPNKRDVIQIQTPYKNKKWVVHGKEFNKADGIANYINPNLVLFDPNDQSKHVLFSQSIEKDDNLELDPTGKLSNYILGFKNLENQNRDLLNQYGEFPIELYP